MGSISSLIDGLIIGGGMTPKTCAQAEGVDTIVFRLDMRKIGKLLVSSEQLFPLCACVCQ